MNSNSFVSISFFISSLLSRMCTTLRPTMVFHYKLWESLSHSLKQSPYRPIITVKQFNHLPRSKVRIQRLMNIFLKDISSILEMNLRLPFNYCYLDYREHPATRTIQTSIPTEKHNNSWIG